MRIVQKVDCLPALKITLLLLSNVHCIIKITSSQHMVKKLHSTVHIGNNKKKNEVLIQVNLCRFKSGTGI